MGIFDNLAKRNGYEKAVPVEKAADFSTGGSWGEIFGGSSSGTDFSSFNSQKEQLGAYVDWVYAATRYIAETCATIDLRVFVNHTEQKKATLGQKLIYHPIALRKQLAKLGTKAVIEKDINGKLVARQVAPLEEVESSPILDLLDCPNPFMTRIEFFEMTFLHLELAGEAFWAINRKTKNGPPTELWPLMPNLVSVVADPEKFVIGYEYTVNGQQIPFAPNDVIHHKYSNPSDFRRGMSPVQAAARIIDTDTHMADHNRRIFYNGATVDAVLYTDNKLTDENWKRLNNQWADKYSGTYNAHRTAILENGLKYQPMALSNRDLNFLEGMNYNRDMILAIFGVPKSLLGMDESMSRANAEAAEYAFSKNKVRPKMLRLTARITEDLAIQFGENLLVSFTDPVPDDKEFLLKEKVASLGGTNDIGYRTPNEVRAEDGDDAIEGGDEIFINNRMIPMAQAAQEPIPEGTPAVAEEDPAASDDNGAAQSGDAQDNDTGDDSSASSDDGSAGSSSGSSSSTTGDSGNSSAGSAGSTSSSTSTGDKSFIKQISARDFPDLYSDLDIDPANLGCIMIDTKTLDVAKFITNAQDDLADENSLEAEKEAHVTLLYGLLENGNKWKDKVDALLKGWNMDSVLIDEVDYFDLGQSYAIVAHIKKTDEIIDGHERLTLLPHINTFSEYKPHLTLAYVKHRQLIADKWVEALGNEYNGKMIKCVGLNYGHPVEEDEETEEKGLKDLSESDTGRDLVPNPKDIDEEVKHVDDEHEIDKACECCKGKGEHYETGYECYRCDASGLEKDAIGDIPCGGREDSDELWIDEDGNYRHEEERKSATSGFLIEPKYLMDMENGNETPELVIAPKIIHDTWSKVADDIKSTAKTPAQLDALHKDFTDTRDRISNKYESDFMKAAHKRFEEQKKEVLSAVESKYKSYSPGKNGITKTQKASVKDLFNKAKSLAKWVASLTPIYKGSVVTAGNAAFNYVADASTQGTSQQFSGADPDIQKFYDERITKVSVGIDETTERLLKTSLIEGLSNGESVAELMNRVEDVYNASAGYRALRIARTEAIDSSTFATINAWKQSGVVTGKKWLVGSSNPCVFCADMDGKTMSLDKNYFEKGDKLTVGNGDNTQTMTFNYDAIDGPPAHPNCTCSLLPILAS